MHGQTDFSVRLPRHEKEEAIRCGPQQPILLSAKEGDQGTQFRVTWIVGSARYVRLAEGDAEKTVENFHRLKLSALRGYSGTLAQASERRRKG